MPATRIMAFLDPRKKPAAAFGAGNPFRCILCRHSGKENRHLVAPDLDFSGFEFHFREA